MVLMTMIARLADGLPLTASIQDDEVVRATFVCLRTMLTIGIIDR